MFSFSYSKKQTIKTALRTLSLEKKGLVLLEQALENDILGPAFFKAVETIAKARGRVIVTGLGKSGHIGTKIAATLASTGTAAFFVHAAEANHGDLGMISQEDVVIALSWSGETIELAGILKHCARFSIPLIALTGEAGSALGKQADIVLLLPKTEEACPHGLAPTTSTLMQLALGDALAVTLLEARGFTATDFKLFHPGGSLGANLQLVKEIMHQGEAIPIVKLGESMKVAMRVLSEKHFGCVAVVDDRGLLAGIVTEGDLVRNLHRDLSQCIVDEVMTDQPKIISPESLLATATALIQQYKISALLVVEENRPVGIVHFHDLLRTGAL